MTSIDEFVRLDVFSEQKVNPEAVKLLRTAVRPLERGYHEFVLPPPQNQDGIDYGCFESFVQHCVTKVQRGLYILVQLPLNPVADNYTIDEISNVLKILYDIIDSHCNKTHGLLFESQVIIIESSQQYKSILQQLNNFTNNDNETKANETEKNTPTQLQVSKILIDKDMEFSKYGKFDFSFESNNAKEKEKDKDNESVNDVENKKIKKYNEVVLGGTFDHLHTGHKDMLTTAAIICNKTLFIGLTEAELLVKKKFASSLESYKQREQNLIQFLKLIKPALNVKIEPLRDLYGPSLWCPMQALVVSKETERGGAKVNEKRKEQGNNALDLIIIDLVGSAENKAKNNENVKSNKKSSTDIREYQLFYSWLKNQWQQLCYHNLFPTILITDDRYHSNDDKDSNNNNKNKQNELSIEIRDKFINEWFDVIFNFYSESHRYYHTLNHIESILRLIIDYSRYLPNATSILFATWFHDIIYNPQFEHSKNELRSIDIFDIFMLHLKYILSNYHNPGSRSHSTMVIHANDSKNTVSTINNDMESILERNYSGNVNITRMLTESDICVIRILIEATIKHSIENIDKLKHYNGKYVDLVVKEEDNQNGDNKSSIVFENLKWFLDFDLSVLSFDSDKYIEYSKNIRKEYIHIESPQFEKKRAEVMGNFVERKSLYFNDIFVKQEKRNEKAKENISKEIQTLLKSCTA